MALPPHLYVPDNGRKAFANVSIGVDCRLKKTLRWKVRESFQDREGYFRVERSVKGGEWEQVGELTDDLFLETTARISHEPDRDTWWRVVLIGKIGEYPSDPIPEDSQPSTHDLRYAHAIYRREYMTLTRYSGMKGNLLHRRTTGALCPVCADEGSGGGPLRSNCQTCDGTGRLGGYYPPVETYAFIQGAVDPTRKTTGPLGTFAPGEKVRARTVVTGWIGTDDVWINATNGDRYLITAVKPEVVYKDYVITYALEMERLPLSHTNVLNTPSVLDKLPAEPAPQTACRRFTVDDFT